MRPQKSATVEYDHEAVVDALRDDPAFVDYLYASGADPRTLLEMIPADTLLPRVLRDRDRDSDSVAILFSCHTDENEFSFDEAEARLAMIDAFVNENGGVAPGYRDAAALTDIILGIFRNAPGGEFLSTPVSEQALDRVLDLAVTAPAGFGAGNEDGDLRTGILIGLAQEVYTETDGTPGKDRVCAAIADAILDEVGREADENRFKARIAAWTANIGALGHYHGVHWACTPIIDLLGETTSRDVHRRFVDSPLFAVTDPTRVLSTLHGLRDVALTHEVLADMTWNEDVLDAAFSLPYEGASAGPAATYAVQFPAAIPGDPDMPTTARLTALNSLFSASDVPWSVFAPHAAQIQAWIARVPKNDIRGAERPFASGKEIADAFARVVPLSILPTLPGISDDLTIVGLRKAAMTQDGFADLTADTAALLWDVTVRYPSHFWAVQMRLVETDLLPADLLEDLVVTGEAHVAEAAKRILASAARASARPAARKTPKGNPLPALPSTGTFAAYLSACRKAGLTPVASVGVYATDTRLPSGDREYARWEFLRMVSVMPAWADDVPDEVWSGIARAKDIEVSASLCEHLQDLGPAARKFASKMILCAA